MSLVKKTQLYDLFTYFIHGKVNALVLHVCFPGEQFSYQVSAMPRYLSLVFALLVLVLHSFPSQAAPVTWNALGAFDDGAAFSGSFVYDADSHIYSMWSITTSPGSLGGFTYTDANSFVWPYSSGPGQVLFLDTNYISSGNFNRYFYLQYSANLSDAGGTFNVVGNHECGYDCSSLRFIVSGTVSSQAVPLPGTLALFGLGLAGLVFSRRKKDKTQ